MYVSSAADVICATASGNHAVVASDGSDDVTGSAPASVLTDEGKL